MQQGALHGPCLKFDKFLLKQGGCQNELGFIFQQELLSPLPYPGYLLQGRYLVIFWGGYPSYTIFLGHDLPRRLCHAACGVTQKGCFGPWGLVSVDFRLFLQSTDKKASLEHQLIFHSETFSEQAVLSLSFAWRANPGRWAPQGCSWQSTSPSVALSPCPEL